MYEETICLKKSSIFINQVKEPDVKQDSYVAQVTHNNQVAVFQTLMPDPTI